MSIYIACCIVLLAAFLLGSIPFGFIIGKLFYHKDPRKAGSGSIGATNMNRTAGWKAGVATFILDALKGVMAVLFARFISGYVTDFDGFTSQMPLYVASVCAVLGHCYSPWLRGKGGKGISVGEGTVLGLDPLTALILLIVFLVIVVIVRIISVGSIGVVIVYPIVVLLLYPGNIGFLATATIIMLLIVFAHRKNIQRLVHGEEPRFSFNTH